MSRYFKLLPSPSPLKLHFGKAETTSLKPIPFREGVIFTVKSINPPPTRTMVEIIRENPDLRLVKERAFSLIYC